MSAAAKKSEGLKVILDSNALFVPIEFKIDIFSEVKHLLNRNVDFILLSPVKRELELLASKESPKIRKQTAYALKFAEKCEYVAVESHERVPTDEAIIKVAKAWNPLCLPMTANYGRRLRDISVPVIYVRQKSRLEIDGLI